MKLPWLAPLLAALWLTACSAPAAQVVVPLPPPPPAAPEPGEPPPVPVEPLPMPAAPRPVRVLTLSEFVALAKPFSAGTYDVVLRHPYTAAPVRVCVTLPVRPRMVAVSRYRLDFRYGAAGAVAVRFLPDGTVETRP